MLRRNVRNFADVNTVCAALWRGNVDLTIVDQGSGEWGYQVQEAHGAARPTVAGRTIDSLLEEHGCSPVDLVKMDIEGSEKDVSSLGPVGWLGRVRILDVELHDRVKTGCAHAVYSAAIRYRFQKHQHGEIDILDFRNKGWKPS